MKLWLAKKLKEKGFTCELPLAMYNELGKFYLLTTSAPYYVSSSGSKYREYYSYDDFDEYDFIAPTISQVLKWLREEKKIHIIVEIADGGWYNTKYPNIRWENGKLKSDKYIMSFKNKESYEQAALAGIEYVLDNLI